MKKVLFLVLSFFTIFTFFACQKKEKPIPQIDITVNEQSVKVNENSLITTITKPTNESKAFDKWLVNGVEVDTTYVVKSGDKLTATWRDFKFFTVSFENLVTPINSQLIREDKLVTNPGTPIKKYYDFKGWYYNSLPFDFNTHLTKDITLTAVWVPLGAPKVKVKLDINGKIVDHEGYYGVDLPTQIDNSNKGYFTHWTKDGEIVKDTYELQSGDVLKAFYKEYVKYTYRVYDEKILNDPSVDLLDSKTYVIKYHKKNLESAKLKLSNTKELTYSEYKDLIPKLSGYIIFAVILDENPYGIDLKTIDGITYTKIPPLTDAIKVMLVKE